MSLKYWISLFSYNGSEFVSKDFLVEKFHFSNFMDGCERHSAIITDIVLKVKDDTNCDWETTLVWAISAKNCLINTSGFFNF